MKWWRKLPGWHKREVAFRDWYFSLLDRVSLASDEAYEKAVRILRCPERVTGYREVRYPKMDEVRVQAESELRQTPRVTVDVKAPPTFGNMPAHA